MIVSNVSHIRDFSCRLLRVLVSCVAGFTLLAETWRQNFVSVAWLSLSSKLRSESDTEISHPESLPDDSETVKYAIIMIKNDLKVCCFTGDRHFKCSYCVYYATQARSRRTATREQRSSDDVGGSRDTQTRFRVFLWAGRTWLRNNDISFLTAVLF